MSLTHNNSLTSSPITFPFLYMALDTLTNLLLLEYSRKTPVSLGLYTHYYFLCFLYSSRYPETCKPLLKCHILSMAVLHSPYPLSSTMPLTCLNSASIHSTSSDLLYILFIAIYLFLYCLLPQKKVSSVKARICIPFTRCFIPTHA